MKKDTGGPLVQRDDYPRPVEARHPYARRAA